MSMTRQEGEALAKIIDFLAKRDDDLANKLRDVVEALVLADAALAERIEAIEESLFEPDATQPPPPPKLHLTSDEFAAVREHVSRALSPDAPSRLQRVLRFLWSPPS